MLPGIVEKSRLLSSIERWKMTAEDGTVISLEELLMSHRHSLSTDPRGKVYTLVGMAGKFRGQRALKINYSLSKCETYIETRRCLMEWRKYAGFGPLDVIGCISPAFSNSSLPL
jgi:hypothetical protein